MAALISWICRVDHRTPDRRGYLPNCTLHDGKWAYCLEGGNRDHTWEPIEPVPIELIRVRRHRPQGASIEEGRTTQKQGADAELDPVDYICITPEHVATGTSVADGHGTLTVNGRQWAYCSAGLKNAPHDWKETGGVPLGSIHHADLPAAPRTS